MSRNYANNVKGYLTIYISLTLTVMLSLCVTLIEGARQSVIRLETECVMDIALNSIMAEYHRELFEQYNLFYIDSSYGSAYPSYYNTEARLKYYIEKNLALEDIAQIDFLYKDLLDIKLGNAYLKEVILATDGNGVSFRKKAAAAVWDDVGVGLAENVLDWAQTIESKGMLHGNQEAQKQMIDSQLAAHDNTERELSEEEWIIVEIVNPTEHINTMRKQGILKWVLNGNISLSGQKVDLSQYISARRRRGQINRGNGTITDEVSVMEQILFHEYVLRYSGHYGQEKAGSLLKYQAEYLVAGKGSDTDNLRYVASTICGIREVANTMYLYQSKEKAQAADNLAWVLAGAIFCPDLQPLFKATLLLGWAYVESLYDTKVLLAGGKVPLFKDDASWHYDLDSILNSIDLKFMKEDKGNKKSVGMSYTDYLHILMYLTDAEKLTFRFMDLIEMDIRQTEGNEAFRMDACIEKVEVEGYVQSGYGYQCIIQREKGYQ